MNRTSDPPSAAGNDAERRGTFDPRAGDPGASFDPTEAEVEAWAERERQRRQAWLNGPTDEERLEWSRRERARRLARLEYEAGSRAGTGAGPEYDPYEERRRLERRYLLEARLAAEGLGVLLATWPFRLMAEMVSAGRDWEEQSLRPPRRRGVSLYDDD